MSNIAADEESITTADMLAGPRRIHGSSRKVLDLLIRGYSNRDIAYELRLRESEVAMILGRCLAAYRLTSRDGLLEWWQALQDDQAQSGGPRPLTAHDQDLLAMEAQRVLHARWRME